jgi:integrase
MVEQLPVTASAALPLSERLEAELAVRLREHAAAARGALAPNTERAIRADTAVFAAWCAENGRTSLPAAADTVAAFIDAMAETKKPATIRRYVSSIAHLHRAAQAGLPCSDERVRLALKRMARVKGIRQQQAAGLVRPMVDAMIETAGERLIDFRNRALLAVAYDTLACRCELVALGMEHIAFAEDGTGTVLIQRSKSDQEAAGQVRFLARDTVGHLRAWLEVSGITEGLLFRSITRHGKLGEALHPNGIPAIWRGMAQAAGLEPNGVSGHSCRVGGAQDMAAAGVELPAVMQAGGWKSPTMPARYSERLQARKSGAAKLARLQGRA